MICAKFHTWDSYPFLFANLFAKVDHRLANLYTYDISY